jgi:hypothetical protein
MTFFIPGLEPEQYEDTLASLAEICTKIMGREVAVPDPTQRVRSITWVHNGTEWTAEVGQMLRGERTELRQVRGRRTELARRLSDPAKVLVIFPGDPTLVFHDGAAGTAWEQPFLAGIPRSIRRFDPPADS